MYGYDIFHDALAEGLINNVRRGNPPHAYIFEGERGVGRYAAARLFAAALACTGQNQPCGVCSSCVGAKSGTNPDIITVEPEEKRKTIGVERIRNLIADAYVRPFLARRKVYIFRDAQIVTEQAQNAFLKLLEEPPEYAVFIIIAQNAELLLQTVRSRCVTIRFSPLTDDKMRDYIEKISPNNPKKDFLVKYSHGIPYEAKKILMDENFETLRAGAFKRLAVLFSDRPLSAYSLCEFAEENKDSAPLIIALWRELVRDIILIQNGADTCITNSDYRRELSELAQRIGERSAMAAAQELMKTEEMLRRYVNLHSAVLRLGLAVKNEV